MLIVQFCYSQEAATQKKWHQLDKENGFQKTPGYKGPNSETYDYPASLENEAQQGAGNLHINPYQGIPYTEKDLQQGGNGGNIEADPDIEESEPIELPQVDSPDVPETEYPSGVGTFFKYFGIIVLLLAIAYIVYNLIKNRQVKSVKSLPLELLDEDINPIEIPKSELQIRLEKALESKNFKECVRIYLLFSLKELIIRKWIFWKKEKTNVHYLIEISGKSIATDFEKLVEIYDLFWYGEYEITEETYRQLEPKLLQAYQAIENAQ